MAGETFVVRKKKRHIVEDRAEATRSEAARDEASRVEDTREEAARDGAARDGAARDEAARDEATRDGATRDEATRDEAARDEATRAEAARDEAARDEATRSEAARDEAARDGAARDEATRSEAARDEATRSEAARDGAARDEATRSEAARDESERSERSSSPQPRRRRQMPSHVQPKPSSASSEEPRAEGVSFAATRRSRQAEPDHTAYDEQANAADPAKAKELLGKWEHLLRTVNQNAELVMQQKQGIVESIHTNHINDAIVGSISQAQKRKFKKLQGHLSHSRDTLLSWQQIFNTIQADITKIKVDPTTDTDSEEDDDEEVRLLPVPSAEVEENQRLKVSLLERVQEKIDDIGTQLHLFTGTLENLETLTASSREISPVRRQVNRNSDKFFCNRDALTESMTASAAEASAAQTYTTSTGIQFNHTENKMLIDDTSIEGKSKKDLEQACAESFDQLSENTDYDNEYVEAETSDIKVLTHILLHAKATKIPANGIKLIYTGDLDNEPGLDNDEKELYRSLLNQLETADQFPENVFQIIEKQEHFERDEVDRNEFWSLTNDNGANARLRGFLRGQYEAVKQELAEAEYDLYKERKIIHSTKTNEETMQQQERLFNEADREFRSTISI